MNETDATTRTTTAPLFTDFGRDPVTMARNLLGQRLVRVVGGECGVRLAGTIVEVEAYLGAEDRAAHTFGGRRTTRNESMYLPGGHAYVYMIYGMHHCLNIVCGEEDEGVAVLVRAVEPTEGIDAMFQRRRAARQVRQLCSGPGKLAEAMAIDRQLDGHDLRRGDGLFIERIRSRPLAGSRIVRDRRVGVQYAGEWADRPLRLYMRDSEYVSRR